MKKRTLLLAGLLLLCVTASAKHKHGTQMVIMGQDTVMVSEMGVFNNGNGQDTVMMMGVETVPIYRILVQDNGRALTAREWASMKTMKMKKQFNLNDKQADKLYKINLKEAKEMESYHAEKHAMKEKQVKNMLKSEDKFRKSLNSEQLTSYNQWRA
ncbi:MAG: hypothetical protein RR341_05730, partial [Bacteroidales bacterium]